MMELLKAFNGHSAHFTKLPFFVSVYSYDPTDDGPECETITRILARHPLYVPGVEKQVIQASRYLEVAALVLCGKPFAEIGEAWRTIVRERVVQTLATKEPM